MSKPKRPKPKDVAERIVERLFGPRTTHLIERDDIGLVPNGGKTKEAIIRIITEELNREPRKAKP